MVPLQLSVITGFVVSTTFTVLVTVLATFPFVSVYVYSMIYVPTVFSSTVPDMIALHVPS